MSKVHVNSERVINAAPQDVYAVLADYKKMRPRMLTDNFLDYKVEKGGHGDGTVVSYRLHAANRERPYKLRVDESVKNEVLTERDSNSSLVTTWALSPLRSGKQTKVRVSTEWEGAAGVGGFFERTFAPLGLRSIYASMLDSLAGLVKPSSPDPELSFVQGEERSPFANATGFLTILGVVVGFALIIRYIQKGQGVDNL